MNSSENAYAGALFFALLSLGALLKMDGIFSWFIGAGSAVLAALSLRFALVKAAQEAEDNHQRLEIQFQQLRSKVIETSEANITAMTSVNDAAQLAHDNLQTIRVRLAELDNLTQIAEYAAELKTTIASLEENSAALNLTLEREFERLRAVEETDLKEINSSIEKLGGRLENSLSHDDSLTRQDLKILKQIIAKIK